MLWRSRFGEVERKLLDRHYRTGEPLPRKLEEAPRLHYGLWFYQESFDELSTERQIGMAAGPIPHSALVAYCDRLCMTDDSSWYFCEIIRRMDSAWLREQDKLLKQGQSNGKSPPVRSSSKSKSR